MVFLWFSQHFPHFSWVDDHPPMVGDQNSTLDRGTWGATAVEGEGPQNES